MARIDAANASELEAWFSQYAAPSDGGVSRMITNIPEVQVESILNNQPTTFLQPTLKAAPMIAPTVAEVDPMEAAFQTVKEFSTKISAAERFEDKNRFIQDLQQSTISVVEEAQKSALAKAEARMNLPLLRDQLRYASERVTKKPELIKEFMQFEQMVQASESRAMALAKSEMQANPKLQSLIKAVDTEVRTQLDLAKRSEQDSMKRLAAKETAEAEARSILNGADQSVLENIRAMDTNIKTDIDMANFLKGAKGKQWDPFIRGVIPPEDYIKAGIAGNPVGSRLAVLEQMKRTGQSEAAVVEDMNLLAKMVHDPINSRSEFTRLGLDVPKEVNKLINAYNEKPSRETRTAISTYMLENANDILKAQTMLRMEKDVSKWSADTSLLTTDPEAKKAYDSLRASDVNRPVDMITLGKAYVNAPGIDRKERIRRQEVLFSSYEDTIKKQGSGGIFHKPVTIGDIDENKRKITSLLATDQVMKGQKTPIATAMNYYNQELYDTVGSVGEFFNNLVGGNR